jgi:S-adenosyl-L-methionine hydrolase (adenosine-forming)
VAKIEGKIVEVSPDGNLISDLTVDALKGVPRNADTRVQCDEHETMGIFSLDHNEPPFTFIALVGASGKLELCIVGDSAKIMLGIRMGTPITLQW